ncbi:MAG TPA: hypothetical protein VFI27_18075, partial [candidate division Zixibacteria bacterium]|nr:hypothetical protein [candidate division Zixibacteria bacterium]
HVDQGPDSILNFDTNETWADLSRARPISETNPLGTGSGNSYNWNAFQVLKDGPGSFTETGRTPIFHYVISAHNYGSSGSSGISRGRGASDFIISLGSFAANVGTIPQQAGTLMHELGHNLNLLHGGDDNINFKPNYLSIMNYSFQMDGVIRDDIGGNMDYSTLILPTRFENNLAEPTGLGPNAEGFGTRHFCTFFFGLKNVWATVINADQPIDWNCDGDTTDTNLEYNINGENGSNQELRGYNDWVNIKLKGGAIGLARATPDLPVETEEEYLTPELAERILPMPHVHYLPLIIRS